MSSLQFSELGLAPAILKTISSLGYEQPSPIQEKSIPLLLEGHNLLGVAQTGTGKTAAFSLPLLSKLDPNQKTPQILVLTPTRELAIQVSEACQSYARGLKGFHVLPVYGGADISGQLRALRRGTQIVVGTPGRIMDHLRRKSLDLGQIKAVVLDEADEMLRMGFIDDVETILAETPDSAQRALFSATMPPAIQRIANNYLGDAQEVHIEAKTRTVERIRQRYLVVNNREKLDALTRILEVEDFDGMIIFVRTKSSTVELSEKLEARGFSASALNGDLNQQLRERTIQRLKNKQLDIIVATDVAARGLDVERISHVFNYDIPYDNESYVHRIGRTGRAGRDGEAILFVTHREKRLLRSIEKSTGQAIDRLKLPGQAEVSNRRIEHFQGRIDEVLANQDLDKFTRLLADMSEEKGQSLLELSAAMAYLLQEERPLFPILEDLELDQPRKKKSRERSERGERSERNDRSRNKDRKESSGRKSRDANMEDVPMETYRIEVGHNDRVLPKDIVGAIANEADIDSCYIGRINISDDFSTVDLPEGMPRELLQHLKKVRICQKPSRMSLVNDNDKEDFRAVPSKKRKSGKKRSSNNSQAPRKPRKRKVD